MRRTTMSQTPWLIRAEGPGPERRRAERTSRAALDLAAVVEQTGGHLVLHQAVDISFAFEAHHLPRGTVDLRSGDPLGAALADQLGSASCRERGCPYVSISVVAVSLKKKKKNISIN